MFCAERVCRDGLVVAFLAFDGLYNILFQVRCGLRLWCPGPRPREVLRDDGMRLLLVLFLCVWLPMAIAAVDAVDLVQSWRKVLNFPVRVLDLARAGLTPKLETEDIL